MDDDLKEKEIEEETIEPDEPAQSDSIEAGPPDYEVVGGEDTAEEEGLGEKLKKVRKELKVCQKERDDYLAGWQRAKADFINARKDEEKMRDESFKIMKEHILKEFLEVGDSLEMAIRAAPTEGLERIYGQFLDLLKQHGVTPYESSGKKFDPMMHEAIEREETDDESKDEMILEELAKGYKFNGRVLRPARVKVGVLSAKGGSASGGKK